MLVLRAHLVRVQLVAQLLAKQQVVPAARGMPVVVARVVRVHRAQPLMAPPARPTQRAAVAVAVATGRTPAPAQIPVVLAVYRAAAVVAVVMALELVTAA